MLKSLKIKNLALIGDAELAFDEELNVLSGETGAGKSIVVDAIMLLLGGKYDKSLLRYGKSEGMVEGVFDSPNVSELLLEIGHEADTEAVVTRRFFDSGKNDIRINGRSVTASMLKRFTEKLIDIYGQHEYISIAKPVEQARLYDYYLRKNISGSLDKLGEAIKRLAFVNEKLSDIGTSGDRERLIDILKYEIDEIERAAVKEGEEEQLMAKRKLVASAEKINSALSAAAGALSEDEENAVAFLDRADIALSGITHIDERYLKLYERLQAASDEIEDIAESVKDELDRDFDLGDLDKLEERLGAIKNIRKKYGDFEQMTKFFNEANEKLFNLVNSDKIYEKLTKEKEAVLDEIYSLSLDISAVRRKSAKTFEREIEKQLSELGMNAKFELRFAPFPSREECEALITEKGLDKTEFYFSPNKGQPLMPMTKIISGGEMSRFMLALKVVNGERDEMPTMIFDEIDVGISGITGGEVAKKLFKLALNHQVLCVTHLPQIAAMASKQFYIEKSAVGEETFTFVTALSYDGMIKEIARLSGVSATAQAAAAAAELKSSCDSYKNELYKSEKNSD